MIPKETSAQVEPVSPDPNVDSIVDMGLYPNVDSRVAGDSARDYTEGVPQSGSRSDTDGNAANGRKRERIRVDRDTEVVVEAPDCSEVGSDVADSPERAQGQRMKMPPKPPSQEELRRHRATHCPFRSWCPKCIAGRAIRGGHCESQEPRDDTPHVNLDYCFIR